MPSLVTKCRYAGEQPYAPMQSCLSRMDHAACLPRSCYSFSRNVLEVSLAVSPEAVTPFHNSAREFVSFTVVTLVSSASQKRPAYACGL